MKAARAGLPQLVIPQGRDQNDNAMRIVHRGAGLMLPQETDSAAVRAAVLRLLTEHDFTRNARALGDRIRAGHDDGAIVRQVEALSLGDLGKARAEVA